MASFTFRPARVAAALTLALALSLGIGTLHPQPVFAEKKNGAKAAAGFARNCDLVGGTATTSKLSEGGYLVNCTFADGGSTDCGFSRRGTSACTSFDKDKNPIDPKTGKPVPQPKA